MDLGAGPVHHSCRSHLPADPAGGDIRLDAGIPNVVAGSDLVIGPIHLGPAHHAAREDLSSGAGLG